jgi:hypothetical protein
VLRKIIFGYQILILKPLFDEKKSGVLRPNQLANVLVPTEN